MKIKWRQHEMILVSIITATLLIAYLFQIHNTSPAQYASPFTNNNAPFNLYKNVIIPQVSAGLVLYLSYLWVNLLIIPRFLFPKKVETGTARVKVSLSKIKLEGIAKKLIKNYLWVIIQIVLLVFIAGTLLNISIYYLHQWEYDYGEPVFFWKKKIAQLTFDIWWGYSIILAWVAVYAVYAAIRETVITYLERQEGKRNFRVMICNLLTSFLVIYLEIPVLLISFHAANEGSFLIGYYTIVLPFFLMAITNLYWIFPLKKDKSLFHPSILFRLLLLAFLYSLPYLFILHEGYAFGLVFCMAVLLFIITPITWVLYEKRKEEIQLLRGAEKTIAKSKTDLQFLRSQINPHFLFNILNTLYGTALQENAKRSAEGIQKLGDMMRFMLHENNLDFIEMDKEINYLKNYISLQKLRTESSSQIIIEDNIDNAHCNHKIAPMLLIPLVENAFKHGISLKEKSWITIALECNEKNILFEVRNSMHAKQENDPEKERSGIGLKNVLERLKLLYPGKFQASINGDEKEFFVQLAIQP